jgi:ceramide glucosyltransferase
MVGSTSVWPWLSIGLTSIPTLYAMVAAGTSLPRRAAKHHDHSRADTAASSDVANRPVSVLKPLCGAEPRLYENLATFCEQTHPCYQLLFGVRSPRDPAIAVVHRLQRDYPDRDITLVVDPHVHGTNLKVSYLINLAQRAKYDWIVIADSDIAVRPDYLSAVVVPLANPRVGVVTCLYRGRSIGGIWSKIGTFFVDQWFAPSVRVAHAGGSTRFGFGATLALRREALDAIGGFAALRNCLADDYWLAERARQQGLRTVLSDVTVSTDVTETTLAALLRRETRWLRTIRSINPLGFAFLFITFTSPWLVASAWLAHAWDVPATPSASALGHSADIATALARDSALVNVCLGVASRVLLHWRSSNSIRDFVANLPLVPLRDTLLSIEWLAAVTGTHVTWRGARIPVAEEQS